MTELSKVRSMASLLLALGPDFFYRTRPGPLSGDGSGSLDEIVPGLTVLGVIAGEMEQHIPLEHGKLSIQAVQALLNLSRGVHSTSSLRVTPTDTTCRGRGAEVSFELPSIATTSVAQRREGGRRR